MLYLEDYIEMIEHLPRELRDSFTEMREIDLQVHNTTDNLEERVKTFFGSAKKLKPAEREQEYESIKRDYYKTLDDSDEKVQIAHQMYDLVDRHLRRLDQELHKFKMELEADNAGITELLERRSLELDVTGAESQKENRYSGRSGLSRHSHERKAVLTAQQAVRREADRAADRHHAEARQPAAVAPASVAGAAYPAVSYMGSMGVGSNNALAAAASQAIAATQHMQQGRRTSSMKASYDAISAGSGGASGEFPLARELAGAAHTALASSGLVGTDRKRKKSTAPPAPPPAPVPTSPTPSDELVGDMIIDPNAEEPWLYDANEPRYCVCQNVSYGDMVACDNRECPFEWFHYACVGITAPPKGKWYCPQCTASMKRRKHK
ncbi:Inhibitor of growth protein 3 [Amphibalanus amphitrite]|uniref:Inhibitor of growth protein n=1 Tax=Amphibalanus amphitrite TaxID=1232801 RepID=A0A6A4XHW3_AMPAM|nr:inhibitor of growth protein 3-like [Amphibalanus amphitrite]XP_043201467.1 inhibitor of growth protein 3-like [Amphibalanus amphitrite]XP_043201468.1 inhibitor of growth protein 3-like [Amphibalanus amphitrite]KAF0290305.1 Inhibitor of growth protein 3 [Amphibalanus amphitrite]KAF0314652.1 Inhibitor of growth protein 3 [Amphibalanus amphitrite]